MQRCCHVRSEQHLRYENVLSTDLSHQSGPKPTHQITSGNVVMSSICRDRVYLKEMLKYKYSRIPWTWGLVMGHLWREVPDQKSCFTLNRAGGQISGHVQKGLLEWLYINCCGIFFLLVSYSISFFSYKTPEDAKEDPDNHEPAKEQLKYKKYN
jgi:hypothetical protein